MAHKNGIYFDRCKFELMQVARFAPKFVLTTVSNSYIAEWSRSNSQIALTIARATTAGSEKSSVTATIYFNYRVKMAKLKIIAYKAGPGLLMKLPETHFKVSPR